MLKKLLKYDLKSMMKYWWIAALASFVATLIGGGCNLIINSPQYDLPVYIAIFLRFSVFLAIIAMVALPLISHILIYVRFYKNFFTDEGYLTFTLPVKRSQLLNSKLISATIASAVSTLALLVEVLIFTAISTINLPYEEITIDKTYKFDIFDVGFILEIFVFFILVTIVSVLFTFCCITVASVIAKKAKLITAIGIYYGTSTIMSGVLEFAYLFGGIALIEKLISLQKTMVKPTIFIVVLCIIVFLAIVSLLLYLLEYFMLDRKLNLS
ncbi:MAG: hypothetical protein IKJ93_01945 [Clostridia bacterium]|nr:hypothetical protein [Clostridia bacterium]